MNETKIEWCHKTLNPCVGCLHGCLYCYARLQAKRQKQNCRLCYEFVPHQHLERLDRITPRQKPKRIFMDSMWDWNSKGIKEEWRLKIVEKMRQCPQHTFQILTKRPKGYSNQTFPGNVWLGTSIARNADLHRIDELAQATPGSLKFVSVEPIHEHIKSEFHGLDWIIVGAETGRRKDKIAPRREWITDIIKTARQKGTPLFLKDNLGWHEVIKEYPGNT